MAEPADLIAERHKTYGDFEDVSAVAQQLKYIMTQAHQRRGEGQTPLSMRQSEALSFIASKIARILVGDPNHADSWDDIAGYAKLGGALSVASKPGTVQARSVTERRSGLQRRTIRGEEMKRHLTAIVGHGKGRRRNVVDRRRNWVGHRSA